MQNPALALLANANATQTSQVTSTSTQVTTHFTCKSSVSAAPVTVTHALLTDVCRKVEQRSRHGLHKGYACQEVCLTDPARPHHCTVQHRQHHLHSNSNSNNISTINSYCTDTVSVEVLVTFSNSRLVGCHLEVTHNTQCACQVAYQMIHAGSYMYMCICTPEAHQRVLICACDT